MSNINKQALREAAEKHGDDDILALLDELEAAHELVELQRFKLERQAEDLHQAKSLASIHREKRFEVEREYSDYKHRAESNSMRLAKEVCRLEDELQAAAPQPGVVLELPEAISWEERGFIAEVIEACRKAGIAYKVEGVA